MDDLQYPLEYEDIIKMIRRIRLILNHIKL